MEKRDWEQAQTFWDKKEKDSVKMEPSALKKEIEKFLLVHNTCALATGCGEYVRCTPIEYSYREDAFWMFSEGGHKFIALEKNTRVALAVYDTYDGFGKLNSLQISGTASLVAPDSEAYRQAAEWKKIPLQALQGLDHPMYLIKVVPQHMDFLCSVLKQQGYAARQSLYF